MDKQEAGSAGYAGYPPRPAGTFPLVRDAFDPERLPPERRAIFDGILEKTTRHAHADEREDHAVRPQV